MPRHIGSDALPDRPRIKPGRDGRSDYRKTKYLKYSNLLPFGSDRRVNSRAACVQIRRNPLLLRQRGEGNEYFAQITLTQALA